MSCHMVQNLPCWMASYAVGLVFVIEIKGHEVSNHSSTAMHFNQQQPQHVVPGCRLVASTPH